MTEPDPSGAAREKRHRGNLREALIQAALVLIAERGLAGLAVAELARAVGVSSAAPYRHFRDRDAVVAEVARRGFDQLTTEMHQAANSSRNHPVAGLERCAQAHLAFAGREKPVYAAMFEPDLQKIDHPDLFRARDNAFAVLRHVAQQACDRSAAARRPPPLMLALHVWSMTHGIAALFVCHNGADQLAMSPAQLLEAGLLVYLQALDLR